MDVEGQLWRLAVLASFGADQWPEFAIDAALTLMNAGDQRPEVVDVATLSPGTTSRDAWEPVQSLLDASAVPVLDAGATDTDRFLLLARALTHGGVSVGEFEPYWWHRLPAYVDQSEEQTAVSVALDDWESEADLASRGPLSDAVGAAVHRWLMRDGM